MHEWGRPRTEASCYPYKHKHTVFAVTDVAVRVAGVPVCVSVVLRDDGAVNEEMNITLSLQADDDRVFTGPPAVITVLDDDGIE